MRCDIDGINIKFRFQLQASISIVHQWRLPDRITNQLLKNANVETRLYSYYSYYVELFAFFN